MGKIERVPGYKLANALAEELGFVLGGNVEVKVLETSLRQRVAETVSVYAKYEYWELTYQEAMNVVCGAPMPKGQKYP